MAKNISRRRAPNDHRRALFVAEYLKDLNAVQAAIRAGYEPSTAERCAWQIMRYPDVKAAIEDAMADRLTRMKATADAAVADLFRRARYDPLDYADITCPADLAKLTPEQRVPIEGWSYDRAGNFILKLSSKTSNGETLLRHLGQLKDKVDLEHSGPGGGAIPTSLEIRFVRPPDGNGSSD
ncbi:Terminase small subunit (plasmid) [Rhodovastum atsumiense]|uniref:Terminase small subunit n=1 Tax=Rhodovastum atsumiense TaxID=504468 RepID=A0A5M6IU69_9PROT|nr:terminase small subunit [Rhodovastum atsumiense]KAA5611866.1 terminase small subunit [Rhodovastum atsumiense]CAH2606156.1 Terminase small subunit [Rhodovastum atsumiense]